MHLNLYWNSYKLFSFCLISSIIMTNPLSWFFTIMIHTQVSSFCWPHFTIVMVICCDSLHQLSVLSLDVRHCLSCCFETLTNGKSLTHHCILTAGAGWPFLSMRRLSHWSIFIYKAIFGKASFLLLFLY